MTTPIPISFLLSQWPAHDLQRDCDHKWMVPHYRITTTHDDGTTERAERCLCVRCGKERSLYDIRGTE